MVARTGHGFHGESAVTYSWEHDALDYQLRYRRLTEAARSLGSDAHAEVQATFATHELAKLHFSFDEFLEAAHARASVLEVVTRIAGNEITGISVLTALAWARRFSLYDLSTAAEQKAIGAALDTASVTAFAQSFGADLLEDRDGGLGLPDDPPYFVRRHRARERRPLMLRFEVRDACRFASAARPGSEAEILAALGADATAGSLVMVNDIGNLLSLVDGRYPVVLSAALLRLLDLLDRPLTTSGDAREVAGALEYRRPNALAEFQRLKVEWVQESAGRDATAAALLAKRAELAPHPALLAEAARELSGDRSAAVLRTLLAEVEPVARTAVLTHQVESGAATGRWWEIQRLIRASGDAAECQQVAAHEARQSLVLQHDAGKALVDPHQLNFSLAGLIAEATADPVTFAGQTKLLKKGYADQLSGRRQSRLLSDLQLANAYAIAQFNVTPDFEDALGWLDVVVRGAQGMQLPYNLVAELAAQIMGRLPAEDEGTVRRAGEVIARAVDSDVFCHDWPVWVPEQAPARASLINHAHTAAHRVAEFLIATARQRETAVLTVLLQTGCGACRRAALQRVASYPRGPIRELARALLKETIDATEVTKHLESWMIRPLEFAPWRALRAEFVNLARSVAAANVGAMEVATDWARWMESNGAYFRDIEMGDWLPRPAG